MSAFAEDGGFLASAPGYISAVVRPPTETVALAPAMQVEGRVVDPDGKGVAGAAVALVHVSLPRSPMLVGSPPDAGERTWIETTTDEAGVFRAYVAPGKYRAVASKDGWVQGRHSPRLRVENVPQLVSAGTNGLKLFVVPVRYIAIRFEDAAGSEVSVSPPHLSVVDRSLVSVGGGFDRTISVSSKWYASNTRRRGSPKP